MGKVSQQNGEILRYSDLSDIPKTERNRIPFRKEMDAIQLHQGVSLMKCPNCYHEWTEQGERVFGKGYFTPGAECPKCKGHNTYMSDTFVSAEGDPYYNCMDCGNGW